METDVAFSIQQHLYIRSKNLQFLEGVLEATKLDGQVTLAINPREDDQVEAKQQELSCLFYGSKDNPDLLTDFAFFITRDLAAFYNMLPLLNRLDAGEDVSLSLSVYVRPILKWLGLNDEARQYIWIEYPNGTVRIWHRTKRIPLKRIAA